MPSPRFKKLDDWLHWMETCHPVKIDMGLDRIQTVASRMSLNRSSAKVITVAGTNGKGSFVESLQLLLLGGGFRVGAYTSPHILRYNERITIDGNEVTDEQLCLAFHHIDHARDTISLTYFEFSTLAALYLFKQHLLDFLILEVGLGGRLDCVNILDPDIAVITSIGIDHERWLGADRDSIAKEKAGILRAHRPFISVVDDPPAPLKHMSSALACDTYALGDQLSYIINECDFEKNNSARPITLSVTDRAGQTKMIRLVDHHLSPSSLLAALQCYTLLSDRDDDEMTARILSSARLGGRFERISWRTKTVILDVAHNPQAANSLAANLSKTGTSYIVLFALMQDKKAEEIILPLIPYVDSWVCAEVIANTRSRSAQSLSGCVHHVIEREEVEFRDSGICESGENQMRCVTHEAELDRAVNKAFALSETRDLPILVFGSFYLIGAIKSMILAEAG